MEKVITDWVKKVSERRDKLGGFQICPFAKKAFEDKKVFIYEINEEPETYILSYIKTFNSIYDFELIIFVNTINKFTNDELLDLISKLQAKRDDLIFLKDHPADPGFINGVNTGNGHYPIILAQPKDKLLSARESLKKTKYYDNWSEEYKNEIWNYGEKANT